MIVYEYVSGTQISSHFWLEKEIFENFLPRDFAYFFRISWEFRMRQFWDQPMHNKKFFEDRKFG